MARIESLIIWSAGGVLIQWLSVLVTRAVCVSPAHQNPPSVILFRMRFDHLFLLTIIIFLCACSSVRCDTITLAFPTALGNETISWFSPDTWSSGVVPQANDTVIIDGRGSMQPVHVVIDEMAPTVEIERLVVFNATLTILSSSTLRLSNTNTSEPSVIRDGSRLLLLDGAALHMPVVCDGLNGTLRACVRDTGFLLDVFEASSIESDVNSKPWVGSSAFVVGGNVRVRDAGSLFSLRARTNWLTNLNIVVTDGARMELLLAQETILVYTVRLQDTSVHIDVSATLFVGYDESFPLGGDCDSGVIEYSSVKIHSVVSEFLEPYECDLCVDGVVELRPLPCFSGAGVQADRVVQSGVLDFRDARFRFRGYTFIRGGGVLSFSSETNGGTARFSHTAVYVERDTHVFVYGGSALEWSDDVLLRGCESTTIDSTLASMDPSVSTTFDAELSIAARQALASLAYTCAELAADSSIVPHFVTKDSDFMLQPHGGRLNLLSLAASSSHFLIDTSWHAVNAYEDQTVALSVGDLSFDRPVFFHIGSLMASAYRNNTTGLASDVATLRIDHPELIRTSTAQVEIDSLALELINCTIVLGHTYNVRAVAQIPPTVLLLRGSIAVEGRLGRFVLGGADLDSSWYESWLRLLTGDSFVSIRDGATFGNMVREENGLHTVPFNSSLSPSWSFRRFEGSNVPALLVESGAQVLFHGNDGWVSLFVGGLTKRFARVEMVDATVHLYAGAYVMIQEENNSGFPRHVMERTTVYVYEESSFNIYASPIDLIDFAVLGDGGNGTSYGQFGVFSDVYVHSAMLVRGVRLVTFDGTYYVYDTKFFLYENTTVDIDSVAYMEFFWFFSDTTVVPDVYERGVAPMVTFRNANSDAPVSWNWGAFEGKMHVYVDCVVEVVWSDTYVSESTFHVTRDGWLKLHSGFTSYSHAPVGVLLIEGGRVSSDDIIRRATDVPWVVTDGGTIEGINIISAYGRCIDGALIDVSIRGVADVQSGSDTRPMSFWEENCLSRQTGEWVAPSAVLMSLRDEYEAWNEPCARAYSHCCVRVSNIPAGLTLMSRLNALAIGENIPSKLLTIDDMDLVNGLIALNAPPSDALFWVFDAKVQYLIVDDDVRFVDSYVDYEGRYVGAPKLTQANVTTADPLPLVDLFGPFYGQRSLYGVQLRLHGYFSAGIVHANRFYFNASVHEFGSDVEAPLVHTDVAQDIRIVARRGAALRTVAEAIYESFVDDDVELILEESTFVVNSSAAITVFWRDFDVELRGGHLNIDLDMTCSGRWFVENGATLTLNKNSLVSKIPMLAPVSVHVRAGARIVFAAGRTFTGHLVMESGSLLVLPGAGGVIVDGNVQLNDGAHILQLYGDGDRAVDGTDVVTEARLYASGDLIVGDNVVVQRVHVDAGVSALTAASSLLVIGASNVTCGAAIGATCNETGLTHATDVLTVECPSVPSTATRFECVQCVSSVATACVYMVVQESADTFAAACAGGSSVDGSYALANGIALNGTLTDWSATVADCYVMSQPRCHERAKKECDGAALAFALDATLDEQARCKWCDTDILSGLARCLTEFEMMEGFCADEVVASTTVTTSDVSGTSSVATTEASLSASSTSTMETSVTPEDELSTGTGSDNVMWVTEPSDDSWVWAVIGALGALMVLSVLTALVCFFTPLGKRRRRKSGKKGDVGHGTIMTSLTSRTSAESLPQSSGPSSGVEYAPMPALTGSSDVNYAEGELEPRGGGAGSAAEVGGEYGSGEMAAPRLLQPAAADAEYASGDMTPPARKGLTRSESEYNSASDMFLTKDSGSSLYAQGELGSATDVGQEYRADFLVKAPVDETYETTDLAV